MNSMGCDSLLTERELVVLRLIAEGHSDSDIADVLVISVFSVQNHNKSIYRKLGAKNRTQAAVWWWKWHTAGRPSVKKNRWNQLWAEE